MNKRNIFTVLGILLMIILISNVFALTAKIGNARMVLRVDTGEQIKRSIRVINDNDVSVEINLFASGDLKDDIEIIDNNFILQPGEEKRAYFTIDVKKSGTTESNINVKFIPEQGNGAGISSTIIIIAKGGIIDGNIDDVNDADINDDVVDVNDDDVADADEDSDTFSITGNVIVNNLTNGKNSKLIAVSLMTIMVFVVFVVLLIVKGNMNRHVETKSKKKKKNG
jgi:hypothetical protein